MHSRDVNWKISIIASIDIGNEKKYQIDNTTILLILSDLKIIRSIAWYMYVIIIFFIEKWTERTKFNYIMIVNRWALFYNLVLGKSLKRRLVSCFAVRIQWPQHAVVNNENRGRWADSRTHAQNDDGPVRVNIAMYNILHDI